MDFAFENFDALTKSASGLTGALQAVAELTGSLKTLLKSPQRASDSDVEAAVDKLSLAMENARLNNALLDAHVKLLLQEIRRSQEAEAKLAAYELHKTDLGHFVYRMKSADSGPENMHFICPNCYENGARSILQGDEFFKKCMACKTGFQFAKRPPAATKPEKSWL